MAFNTHRWALLFLVIQFVVGLWVVGDFGITWDEQHQRDYGRYVHHYVHYGDQFLHEYASRYHGPAFQYVLYQVEYWLRPMGPGDVYRMRHGITWLFSVIGSGFFYLLALRVFRSRGLALFGLALLVLSPRILSHSFYNSKDASFMYMFIIASYTMLRMLAQVNWHTVALHALACAVLIDMRILGVFVPFFTGVLLLPRFFWSFRESLRQWPLYGLFGFLLVGGVILFWPTLWRAPAAEFLNALRTMSAYPWEYSVLFRGEFIHSGKLPWTYLPVWMVITTPLIHLGLIVIGAVVWTLSTDHVRSEHRMMVILWAVVPLLAIVGKGSVVYDGWRHMFFIWPALVLLALAGTHWLHRRLAVLVPGQLVWALLFGTMLIPLSWIVRHHPHQAVYFNALAGESPHLRYEADYWGGSYKQALEWLVEHVDANEIELYPAHLPGELNIWMLSEPHQARIRVKELGEAEYLVSNHRYPEHFKAFTEGRYPYDRPLHQISVDGGVIVGVYRLR